MEKMVSSWCTSVKSVPQDYVFPDDTRPGDQTVPICNNLPVIDLEKAVSGDPDVVQQILQACLDSGFFQVINHGISQDLINDTMGKVKEFFELRQADKESLYSLDFNKSCRLYTSSFDYAKEAIHLWRDVLKHNCHPLDEWVHYWPEKPSKYRDVVGKYSVEVRNLSLRILEIIREAIGLKPDYFGDELTGIQSITVNHYPPCPDPSLTLGIQKHSDLNVITILYQGDICGLQVMKDGQWVGVEPIANAFVVNIGQTLKVISNGKFESCEHRAITNLKESRYTIASFITPRYDAVIKPERLSIHKDNFRPIYRAFQYKDFHHVYQEHRGDSKATINAFKIE